MTTKTNKTAKYELLTSATTREEMISEINANIGNLAQIVVPDEFGLEWLNCTIVSILNDKRAKKPMFVVELEGTRKKYRKVYGSNLIKVSETADKNYQAAKRKVKQPLTIDEIKAEIAKLEAQLAALENSSKTVE